MIFNEFHWVMRCDRFPSSKKEWLIAPGSYILISFAPLSPFCFCCQFMPVWSLRKENSPSCLLLP